MSRRLLVFCTLGALALLAFGGGLMIKNLLPGLAETDAAQQAASRGIAETHKQFYASLDKQAQAGTAADVSTYIHAHIRKDPALLAVALDWARDNSAGHQDLQNLNGFYFMLYADLAYLGAQAFELQGMQDEYTDLSKTAFASLLTFDLLAATDALRCADTSVRTLRAPLVRPRYALLDYVFDLMTYEEMQELFITILRSESAMGMRGPNRELCAGGEEGKRALLEHPGARRAQGVDQTILIPPQDFTYEPQYVSHDEWLEARGRMQNAVRDSWFQRQINYANRKAAELRGERAPDDRSYKADPALEAP